MRCEMGCEVSKPDKHELLHGRVSLVQRDKLLREFRDISTELESDAMLQRTINAILNPPPVERASVFSSTTLVASCVRSTKSSREELQLVPGRLWRTVMARVPAASIPTSKAVPYQSIAASQVPCLPQRAW